MKALLAAFAALPAMARYVLVGLAIAVAISVSVTIHTVSDRNAQDAANTADQADILLKIAGVK
jgi:hypothetical protein